jgi:HAD superfamily hydrolase (TIGR01509 family)
MMEVHHSYIFDLDGVMTDTRPLHAKAWEVSLNAFLYEGHYDPFTYLEYQKLLDGRPRKEGVRNFLDHRKIHFRESDVGEISTQKNLYFLKLLDSVGVKPIRDSLIFVHNLKKENYPLGLVTSSRNAHKILSDGGILDLFDVIMTPVEGDKKNLKGKPSPDYFLECCRLLGREPSSCTVVEDAISGVEAALKGGFGEVIGFDFEGNLEHLNALKFAGADVVVDSLLKLEICKTFRPLPNFLDSLEEKFIRNLGRDFILFLDLRFDIVEERDLIFTLSRYVMVCIFRDRNIRIIKDEIFKIKEEEIIKQFLGGDGDKGKVLLKIYEVFGLDRKRFFPLCIGDEATSEDAFREMRHWGVSIITRNEQRPSLADFHLKSLEEVKLLLQTLLNHLRSMYGQMES